MKTKEFKTVNDVIAYILENLDSRIADYRMAEILGSIPKIAEEAPEDIKPMLRNVSHQIECLNETRKLLSEILLERQTLERLDTLKGKI